MTPCGTLRRRLDLEDTAQRSTWSLYAAEAVGPDLHACAVHPQTYGVIHGGRIWSRWPAGTSTRPGGAFFTADEDGLLAHRCLFAKKSLVCGSCVGFPRRADLLADARRGPATSRTPFRCRLSISALLCAPWLPRAHHRGARGGGLRRPRPEWPAQPGTRRRTSTTSPDGAGRRRWAWPHRYRR